MTDVAEAYDARLVDSTSTSPLEDRHFAPDFDHLTPEGMDLLTAWYLDGALSFLLQAGD